jgi:ribosomal protein S18 acetylase RimI-like enzyme
MEILKAQSDDLPEILELQKLCYTENANRYNNFDIQPLTQTLPDIENEYKKCTILKSLHQSKIVGSVRAFEKEGTCYIGKLIVHPDYQNKGIGRMLMNSLELEFGNAKRFELFTGFRDEKNLYFYKKIGYSQFKQVKVNDNLSLVYLEKINLK